MATFHHPHFFSSNDLLKPPNTAKPNNTPSRRILPVISRNAKEKEEEAWKEKKKVFVDYDEGSHYVCVQLSGIRKAELPQHKRVLVAGDRLQKDWSISEVVQRVLGTKHREGIEGLLNRCKPDAETFNALINVHGRAGQWRWAMNIMDDMLRAAGCIYNGISLWLPDLVPSVLALLQTKAVEVIKAVLGFVKVLVLCHQAKDLQNILPDIVNEVVRWSSVSRHHFRAKVTVILEILMRRCGSAQVKLVTPEKHLNFVKGILENRHGKASSKESSATDMEPEVLESSPRRMRRKRKREEPSIPSEEDGKVESRFRKRGMKLVKKAGSHTADRRTEGQSRGTARNKRNFNGDPTEPKHANKAHERKKKILRG